MLTKSIAAGILSGVVLGETKSLNAAFHTAVDAWLSSYSSENTRSAYRGDLNAFSAWCAGQQVSPLDTAAENLAAYRNSFQPGQTSPAVVARRVSAITSFFRYTNPAFVAPGASDDFPPSGYSRGDDSSTVALQPEETESLLASFGRLSTKIDVLIAMLLLDGLKLSEVLNLDVECVSGRSPNISASIYRRTHQQVIEVDPRTAAVLGAHLRRRRSGPLLMGESRSAAAQQRLTRFGADYLLKKAGQQAGLGAPLTANVLRRTYVVNAHLRGDRIDEIRHHLGQRDVRTTRRYLPTPPHSGTSFQNTPAVDDVGSRPRPEQGR